MFIVFNKEKMKSYVILLSTVVILFGIAFGLTSQNIVETAASTKQLPIYNVATDEKKVAFTMNCAWNADDIDSILQILANNNIHITFFMVGEWVTKYPDAVKKIYEAGHEIANHSDTHPHVNNLNLEENREQIIKCSQKIEKITGEKTTLYRGPYGEYNDTVINAAKSQNHVSIQWNLDTLDYSGLTGEEMWKRLENKLSSGSIILSHNGTKHTADSLDMLIKNIKEKGYEIVTVSELIYKDNYYIDVNGIQRITSEYKK